MGRLLQGFELPTESTTRALDEIRLQGDVSQVPVLLEIFRFMPADLARYTGDVLRDLTGQDLDYRDWSGWMEWLGQHSGEFRPPEGYGDWKAEFMSMIDPRFATLLRRADETSRIDLTEVAWGGVVPDGIPDLRNPPAIPADEAAYPGADERVVGVSINGENRAYPLRILNPHEMLNDFLGDEPIALVW